MSVIPDTTPAVEPAHPAHPYLRRLGSATVPAPTAAALRDLHRRHLVAVPYHNLSIHLGRTVELDLDRLRSAVVDDHDGGMCYELNASFAALLTDLGYRVELLAARVFLGPLGFAQPFSHIALRVHDAEGSAWLADVGFGRHSHFPLRMDERGEQRDPGGVFQLVEAPGDELDLLADGAPRYRLDLRARELAEFEDTSRWMRTAPQSPFVHAPICSRLTADGGRVTINGRSLVVTDAGGQRVRATLADEDLVAAYRRHFGLALDRVPDSERSQPFEW